VSSVFVTGGTGYLGRPLIAALIAGGRPVDALVRKGSEGRLPAGARAVFGDALEAATFADAINPGSTIVHLVGPVMKTYIAARVAGEALVAATGIPATILRPWYVLGPGHRWPYAIVPFYALLRALPPTREGALRLGLVSRRAMVAALVRAVETAPAGGVRIVEVPEIRGSG
jgi:uncharacterized protein YbjT (DUF2867 family)